MSHFLFNGRIMMDYQIMARIAEQVEIAFGRLEAVGFEKPVYKLRFTESKSGSAGQCAYSNPITLTFNVRIASIPENTERYLRETPAHEAVHAVLPVGCNHGRIWKHVMRLIGQEPAIYHDYIY